MKQLSLTGVLATTALALVASVAPAEAFSIAGNTYTSRSAWEAALGGKYPLVDADFSISTSDQQVINFGFNDPDSSSLTVESKGINGSSTGFNRIEPSGKYSGGLKRGNPPGNNDNNFFDEITWTFSKPIKGFFADKFTSIEKIQLFGNFDGVPGDEVINLKDVIGGGTGSFGLIADSKFTQITYRISAANNNASDNFKVEGFTAAVPTPALLPGLIGMGVAALRKRRAGSEEPAEA